MLLFPISALNKMTIAKTVAAPAQQEFRLIFYVICIDITQMYILRDIYNKILYILRDYIY